MSLMTQISNQNTDPAKTYTLTEFISVGKTTNSIMYPTFCYQEYINNVRFVVKNVLDDYIPELKSLAYKVQLEQSEIDMYKYNPKLLSYNVYGTTVYYPFILMINDMCSIREFDQDLILLIPKTILNQALSSIYRSEITNIDTFNNTHN